MALARREAFRPFLISLYRVETLSTCVRDFSLLKEIPPIIEEKKKKNFLPQSVLRDFTRLAGKQKMEDSSLAAMACIETLSRCSRCTYTRVDTICHGTNSYKGEEHHIPYAERSAGLNKESERYLSLRRLDKEKDVLLLATVTEVYRGISIQSLYRSVYLYRYTSIHTYIYIQALFVLI